MFFIQKAGDVFIDKDYLLIPSIKAYSVRTKYNLETGVGNEKERRFTRYLYYVYHKRSQFYHLEKVHRKELCSRDYLGGENDYKALEKSKIIKSIINDLLRYQFTENEAILQGVREKVSEYILYWNTTDITGANANTIKSRIKDATELVALRKSLEQEIFKELSFGGEVDADKDTFIERILTDKKRAYEKILAKGIIE